MCREVGCLKHSNWRDVKYDNVEMVALAFSKIGYGIRVRVITC